MSNGTIPYLYVAGTPYEIGFKIGSHFRFNIHHILEEFDQYQSHKKRFLEKKIFIQKMLQASERLCPAIVEEIHGMSDGCTLEFMDLFIHNCMHMPYWSNCSTGVLKKENVIYITHNEDAHPLLEKYAYHVFVQRENPEFIPFFSHCYPGIIPGMSYGFNMAGLVETCNSLPDPTKSVGIPRMFVGRNVYEKAHSVSEAISIINSLKPRCGGANYNLVSMKDQKLVSIETTGDDYSIINIQDRFFRANHYISGKFHHYPPASHHTIIRQNRGNQLIKDIQTPNELLNIMWDDSVFLTMENTNNDCQTNSTLAIEITSETINLKKYTFPHQNFTRIEYNDLV